MNVSDMKKWVKKRKLPIFTHTSEPEKNDFAEGFLVRDNAAKEYFIVKSRDRGSMWNAFGSRSGNVQISDLDPDIEVIYRC